MSGSSSRWQLYDLVERLRYHKLPDPGSEEYEGLGEAVLWLRRHTPLSNCREHLESALRKLGEAAEELDRLERQLTSVARAIEGDDGIAVAIEDIFSFDCESKPATTSDCEHEYQRTGRSYMRRCRKCGDEVLE